MRYQLSFYSLGLQHIQTVELDEIVDGLTIFKFKSLPCAKRDDFIMLAFVHDVDNMEAHGISIHNGDDTDYHNFLLTQFNVIEDPSNPSLAVQSIKNSLLFKGYDVYDILVLV